jgi:hypothetical protein
MVTSIFYAVINSQFYEKKHFSHIVGALCFPLYGCARSGDS